MQPEIAARDNPYRAPAAVGPPRPELKPYRDLRTACSTLVLLLWTYVAAAVASSLATVAFYAVGPASIDAIGLTDDATLWGTSMILANGMCLLVMLVCMIFFGRFLYLSNLNARAFGIVPLEYSAASMVWWFFIPFACLFKPYQAVKQVYWASLKSSP